MLTSYEEIKRQLLEDYDRENLNQDTSYEIADNNCPVYYADTIAEWQVLPSEYCDTWQDYGITEKSSIVGLMTIDLFNYYHQLADRAYLEITEEENN